MPFNRNSRGGPSSRGQSSRGGRGGPGGGSGNSGPSRRPTLPFALADELGIDTKRNKEKERERKRREEDGSERRSRGRGIEGGFFGRGGARAGAETRTSGAAASGTGKDHALGAVSTESLLAELRSRPSASKVHPTTAEPTFASKPTTSNPKKRKHLTSSDLPTSLPASLLSTSSSTKKRKTKQEIDEDAEIAWLEYHLGNKKAKSKSKSKAMDDDALATDGLDLLGEDDDGLADLLGFVDSIVPGPSGPTSAGIRGAREEMDGGSGSERDDAEDDEEEEQTADGSERSESEDEDLEAFYTDDEEEGEDDQKIEETKRNTARNAHQTTPIPPISLNPSDASPEIELQIEAEESNKGVKAADAYGTPISTLTTSGRTKYVPPALRNLQGANTTGGASSIGGETGEQKKSDEKIKLERKVQGLLNRLGEANVDSILGELEGVYRENARNDVTSTITEIIIGTIADKANLLETFVVLYASLVAALYKVVGVEFGAYFVQTLVTRYDAQSTLHQTTKIETSSSDAAKQPLNMLTLIAELYNFQVVSCKLVYDIVKGFIDAMEVDQRTGEEEDASKGREMGEFPVEGLLKVMRCSGPQLRSDDPTALKDIVQLVQQKTAGWDASLSPRSKFMIETLVNIKNNKSKSVPGGQMGAEATMRMKKYLAGLSKKRTILTYEPLRVSLQDILSADTKGKWWLVGAGWAGNPLVDRQANADVPTNVQKAPKKSRKGAAEVDDNDNLDSMAGQDGDALLKLARKQGMNTDIRRSVFVILMTSDDFMHATDRLGQLKLTELQEREFVRVALHCCSVEPSYNPYYALFLAHICSESYSHRFTLQYAIWDLLRDLGEKDVGGNQISEGGRSSSMAFGADAAGGAKALRNKVTNLGKLFSWVVASGGADLTVFKSLDFTAIAAKSTFHFLDTFLTHLILACYASSPVFQIPPIVLTGVTPKAQEKLAVGAERVRSVFERALSRADVSQGLSYHLATRFIGKKVVVSDAIRKSIGGNEVLELVMRGFHIAQSVLVNAQ